MSHIIMLSGWKFSSILMRKADMCWVLKSAIPNLFSELRILCALSIGYIYSTSGSSGIVLVLFLFAGLTDVLDGWFARRLCVDSIVGKALDRLADATLYSAVLISWITTYLHVEDYRSSVLLCGLILLAHIVVNLFIYPLGCEYHRRIRKFCTLLLYVVCFGLLSGSYEFSLPNTTALLLILSLLTKLHIRKIPQQQFAALSVRT